MTAARRAKAAKRKKRIGFVDTAGEGASLATSLRVFELDQEDAATMPDEARGRG